MTRLSGKSLRSRQSDPPVNPMDSVSNLADAMLDPSISFEQDDLTESQDDAKTIEGDLTEMGKVYYDQQTGTYYIVENPRTGE